MAVVLDRSVGSDSLRILLGLLEEKTKVFRCLDVHAEVLDDSVSMFINAKMHNILSSQRCLVVNSRSRFVGIDIA